MQNHKSTWALVGALALLVAVLLGLVFVLAYSTSRRAITLTDPSVNVSAQSVKEKRDAQNMRDARNRDTSNFDNLIQF